MTLKFLPAARAASYVRFANLIKEEIYQPGTTTVKPEHDFTKYYR